MTPEEALRRLEIIFVYGVRNNWRDIEARNIAIEAIEKQTPKKPKYYVDRYDHERPGCPECPRNEILYAGQKYCSVCGTKIDWSDPKHD